MSVRITSYQIVPLSNSRFHFPSRLRMRISCISDNKSNSNEDDKRKPIRNPKEKRLSMRPPMMTMSESRLTLEAEKMKVQEEERERAMRNSAKMLFDDLCGYLKMKSDRDEVKRRWRRMPEEERRGLVAEFVSDWGIDFQPLSRKGVKQLLDQFVGVDVGEGIPTPNLDSVAALGMFGLKRLIGFVSD